MKEQTELKLIFYFIIAYMAVFTFIAVLEDNYEFIYYAIILFSLIFVIIVYYQKMHLSKSILLGATLWGIMHMLGGCIYIFGTRLYDFYLIPHLFRYDNLVHAFGTSLVTFVIYSLVRPHLDNNIKGNFLLLSLIIVSAAMGVGAYNEISELIAVVFLNASKAVGDYYNNALDLVFNLLGSIAACFFVYQYHKKRKKNH